MKLLNLENIYLNFYTNKGETKALNNINLNVTEGEFVAIVGPSGCGKTTILNLVAGLLSPTSGTIKLNNESINMQNNNAGYMFQHDHLFEWRTVWQNVCLGLEINKTLTQENKQLVNELLNKYGLDEFKNHYPKQLSGGMRQRVALIRTLALRPNILLLDEPFSALDFQTRLEVCDDVYKIIKKEKKTTILVTHDLNEAISMADRVVVLGKRPATIKKIFKININKKLSPLKRRQNLNFSKLFDVIYKELQYENS